MNADDGLKIETAASIVLRDLINKHMTQFLLAISGNRHAGQAVVAAYIDGLSGAMALVIKAKHASKEEVVGSVLAKLHESLDRDLQFLGRDNAKH